MRYRSWRGFTLVEMLLGLVVSSVVAAAVLGVTIRQQRLAQALGAIINVRRAVREGADMLRYDLRAAAPRFGGVYALGPDFIEFRSSIGTSVACAIDSSRTAVVIPSRGTNGAALTTWVVAPDPGDTVLVLDDAASDSSVRWRPYVLATAPSRTGTCPRNGVLRGSEDSASDAVTIHITAPLGAGIQPGSALRFVRRVRYQIYRAGDGEWYLGYLDCISTRALPCAGVQPVSGPYSASGAAFQYFDSDGVSTTDRLRVARIEIALRASSRTSLRVGGLPGGRYADSIALTITPRN